MDCRKFDNLIMEYLDGRLSSTKMEYMQIHMGKCSRCCNEFEAYIKMAGEIQKIRIIQPPSDFEQQVMSKLESNVKVKSGRTNIIKGIVAAVILMILLWTFIMPEQFMNFNIIHVITVFTNAIGRAADAGRILDSVILSLANVLKFTALFFAKIFGVFHRMPLTTLISYYAVVIFLGMVMVKIVASLTAVFRTN